MTEAGRENPPLLLGIDLGTARTAVVSTGGYRGLTPSVVGYPRDIIAVKMLGKTQVFGEEALAHKSALVLYHPLREELSSQGGKGDYHAAAELLRQVVGLALEDRGPTAEVGAIIGVPARISENGRQALQRMVQPLFHNVLVISSPYLVAYHLGRLNNSLVVDIGAGAVTVCAIRGAAPGPRDQAILTKAGDYLDERLQDVISQSYPEVQISRNLARQIKEQHAYVGAPPAPVQVTLRAQGKPRSYDLTSEMGAVCAGLVPDIVERLILLLQDFDPEDQEIALNNIYLTGGGSRIDGLAEAVAAGLIEYGSVQVSCVKDGAYAGAEGALRLAAELPADNWREFGLATRI